MNLNFCIINKYFSKEDNLFHIVRKKKDTSDRVEKTYNSFDKFYKH